MRFVVLQVIGMVLVAVGAQGAIRLLVDHDRLGLLGWLFGKPTFAVALCVYVGVAVVGVLLAGWAHDRAKAGGHLE